MIWNLSSQHRRSDRSINRMEYTMSDTARTLFKGGTIVTMDAKVPNLVTGDVLIEGDRIVAVEANIRADGAEVIDAAGNIVLPGLIDAHHHAWLGVMRRLMPDVDACHSSRSPEHTDAALESLDSAGIRALHMVGAAMDKKASAEHLPRDLERLALNWNTSNSLVRVGLFGQLNLDWWKVARGLNMHILTEFIGDLAKLGPQFAEPGILGPHNIFNHCTRVPEATWKLFADAGVNITVNPRSDALFGFDDDGFAYQKAIDHGLMPALGIDLDTAFGSDMFGEMHALFGQQRAAMRYRRFRGEADAPSPISVDEVLRAATVNGARAAGLATSIGTLTPGKQADIIMLRTNGVAVFPVTNAIGTIVQAVERSDVDTVMVAGRLRKRSGKLIGVDIEKLTAKVIASRDYLLEASGYRTNLFGKSVPALGVTA